MSQTRKQGSIANVTYFPEGYINSLTIEIFNPWYKTSWVACKLKLSSTLVKGQTKILANKTKSIATSRTKDTSIVGGICGNFVEIKNKLQQILNKLVGVELDHLSEVELILRNRIITSFRNRTFPSSRSGIIPYLRSRLIPSFRSRFF